MTIAEDPGEISGLKQPAWDSEQSMDKALSQPRADWDNSSLFEGDQIPPCNAYTSPMAKIISDGMCPVSVTGHTVLITLSFLLRCDMIKFRVYEHFSIKSFFSYGHLLKKNPVKTIASCSHNS